MLGPKVWKEEVLAKAHLASLVGQVQWTQWIMAFSAQTGLETN